MLAWSRHDETPREQVLELTEDGRDYRVLEIQDEETERGHGLLFGLLEVADSKLTRRDILTSWPERRRPHEATLHRWLERLVDRRLILAEGTGRRNDPFRYWLPGRDHLTWQPDLMMQLGL